MEGSFVAASSDKDAQLSAIICCVVSSVRCARSLIS